MGGYIGIIMYADGRNGTFEHEGTQNNTKIYTNGRVGQYLITHDHGKKKSLTFGLPKNQTERAMDIIFDG